MCQDQLTVRAATDPDHIALDDVDDGSPSTYISDTTRLLRDQASTRRLLTREPPFPEGWKRDMQVWGEAMNIVARAVKLPPASGDRPPRPFNPHNARDIMRLYRRNRKRAVRLIFDDPPQLCPIPLATLEDHFEITCSRRSTNTPILLARTPAADEINLNF
ncbi:hypothetical protein HPB49_023600 [Dermacentor silvarum]|uniref:Uncharacterized protein n=1 Tax=Dermacentor silvarum TaxID=543639 RepID=A0ACB8D0V8_DERSI|nr:hypothetical protein HPB49_023600 [Dermacentor silvarum]